MKRSVKIYTGVVMMKNGRIHSIQTKIMVVSLLIAVGTTIVSLFISYYTEINTIKSMTEKYTKQYISFADKEFNNIITEAQRIALSIAVAQEFIDVNLLNEGEETSYAGYRKKMQIKSFLSGYVNQKEYIDDIWLVTEDQQIYQASKDLIMKRDLNLPVIEQALANNPMALVYDESHKEVMLCRTVSYCRGQVRGTVVIRLNYDMITSVYHIDFLQLIILKLYLPDGRLFFTNSLVEDKTYDERSNDEHYYRVSYISDTNGMTLEALIPQSILLKDAKDLKIKFLLIGAVAATLALFAAIYLSTQICASIKDLSARMDAVRMGDLSVRMNGIGKDEIGDLAAAFNEMMERITLLMAEVLQKEKMKREAEQDVLASQIEPHFLYNSIDSIRYVAHMRGETEIERVTDALSELLRSVLSNHNEFITLWEEREYVEHYINIERFKYSKPFHVIWEVDEELWTYPIPKLLLQPVVENALIHGIASKEESGVIDIKIYRQQSLVICKVMDNGKGISEQKLLEIMSSTDTQKKTGFRRIGISNVFSRIRLIYGEEYGGRISSCEGMFTSVELYLPGGDDDGADSIIG